MIEGKLRASEYSNVTMARQKRKRADIRDINNGTVQKNWDHNVTQ